MTNCTRVHCDPDDHGCSEGHMQASQCEFWQGSKTSTATEEGAQVRAPWTGVAMGLVDIALVSARARPVVVGVFGAENAGKTTLLAAWYILIGRGREISDDRRFAGSFTLEGWEALAAAMRWAPGKAPTFPPHTTSQSGRAPGLLHLAFRQRDGRLRDVMFADAPGEWFRRWTINESADDTEGARWVAEQADVLLIVADCDALGGESLGAARHDLQTLAHRVAKHRRGRPVALVWAKADVDVDPAVEASIRGAVQGVMGDVAEFRVSIKPDEGGTEAPGVLDLLGWVMDRRRPPVTLTSSRTPSDDFFLRVGTV